MKKTILISLLCSGFFVANAQEKEIKIADSVTIKQEKMADSIVAIDSTLKAQAPEYASISPLPTIESDSLKISLMDYHNTVTIDSIWQHELFNSALYPRMQEAIEYASDEDTDKVFRDLPTDTLKARLAKLNATTPFHVEYSHALENTIHYYLQRDKKLMERMMSLSQYYFPMFEEELDKYNIPLEIKYLAVVESALNPRAKSRVGATGLWQFMFSTGKMHGLKVSSYVDERMDPRRSTEAACQYLSSLYQMFGDWDLALASYNSGPGNVSKAIRRSGGNTNYWEIRRYLPRETAGYVPAFLATMYLFEYANDHGFKPYRPEVTFYETDTIHTKGILKFDQIEKVTGITPELLSFLNPSYKLNIIPKINDRTYALTLPRRASGLFVANEEVIYNFAQKELAASEKPMPRYYEANDRVRYRVRPGDYLGRIAERFGVGVSKIKRWNHLRGSQIRVGQYLTIYPRKPVAMANTSSTSPKKSHSKAPSEKTYTVKPGDSLWSISRKFPGVTVQNIQKWNDISGNKLKPGMKLKLSEG